MFLHVTEADEQRSGSRREVVVVSRTKLLVQRSLPCAEAELDEGAEGRGVAICEWSR